MATELLMEISQDERQRAILLSRRKYETDMMSRMLAEKRLGKMEGKIEGKIEGAFEERRTLVNHMYREGFDVKTISKALGLSEQDVKNILGQ